MSGMMNAPLGAVYPSVSLNGRMATCGTIGAGGRKRSTSLTTWRVKGMSASASPVSVADRSGRTAYCSCGRRGGGGMGQGGLLRRGAVAAF